VSFFAASGCGARLHVIKLDAMGIQAQVSQNDIRIISSTRSIQGCSSRTKFRRKTINDELGEIIWGDRMLIVKKVFIQVVLSEHVLF
jgi:hypothetical protein